VRRLLWLGDSLLIATGVIGLSTSACVRNFARSHGVLMLVGVLALLTMLGIAIDRALAMRAQRDEARARYPKITSRDQELFDRIDQAMGRGAESTSYLRSAFNGKSWQWTPLQPYLSFADNWGYDAMFDDPVLEAALRTFHETARDFYSDAAVESSSPVSGDRHHRFAVLNDGPHRPQYSKEWTATRNRLIGKAQATAEARDALYLLGRQRGY